EVVGLLGPNGAGKTTLFDVLSGHLRPTSGAIELHGRDITGLRPEQRAQLGLGRTFQQARLFDDLTVFEAVQLGLERREPSEFVPVLAEIRDHLGATLVIVEHDIPLMMSLVDRLYVLAAGR